MLAALSASLALAASPAPSRAPAPAAEAQARAACLAEGRRLVETVPAGACDTPDARIRFLTRAREMCVRNRNVDSPDLVCRRAPSN